MGEWTSNDENIPKRRQEISSLPTGENTPKQARQVFPYPLEEIKLDMSSHVPQYMANDKFTSKYSVNFGATILPGDHGRSASVVVPSLLQSQVATQSFTLHSEHRRISGKLLPIQIPEKSINNIYEWCRDHRVHHKFTETDADPHNIKRGFFFAHIGWLMCRKHPDVAKKGKTISVEDLMADPIVRFQRRLEYFNHFCKLLLNLP
ncbi:Stearoyl-CoA desaturase 5 [Araneus ventricosus]|uniref:Stearoyl-CoA desaturase 5 n=1 Tax=Araneus ventricosus TaxID=182803 RepID=A0A4Y2G4S2_ARAVE|nr:Stearoyl-CoA desaturase 5 [Araneus ventricosus]